MKKLILILAAVMLMSALFLTACNSGNGAKETEANTNAPTESNGATVPGTTAETPAATEATTKVTYTVTVQDQDGNPVAGARVQMCQDELCMLPKTTNADGVATFEEDKATYRAKLATLPEGYTADMNAYHEFPADSTEVTITVTKG